MSGPSEDGGIVLFRSNRGLLKRYGEDVRYDTWGHLYQYGRSPYNGGFDDAYEA